jgi:hypothetical protein
MSRKLVVGIATTTACLAALLGTAVPSQAQEEPSRLPGQYALPTPVLVEPSGDDRVRQGLPPREAYDCEEARRRAMDSGQDQYQCVVSGMTDSVREHFSDARLQARESSSSSEWADGPRLAPPTVDETFNSACDPGTFVDRWFYSNRFTMCFQYGFIWFRQNTSGVVISEVEFAVHQEAETVVNGGATWKYETWITPTRGFGDLTVGGGIRSALSCSVGCTNVDNVPGEQPIVIGRQLYGNWTVNQPTAAQQFTTTTAEFRVDLMHVSGVLPISFLKVPNVRCDSGFPERNRTTGCIFTAATGAFFLSVSDPAVNETAAHILSAQETLAGHPGWFGHGNPLTYLADRQRQQANRRAVCGNFQHLPGGSCDEYPFASTHQGGNPATTSVEDVVLDDNTTAGGRLGNSIQVDRLLDGERFWVVITG